MSNANNLLTRIFTQSMLSSFISSESLPLLYQNVIRRYHINADTPKNNAQILSEIYSVVEGTYRYEYYYKNTLLNKLLINAHRLKTTTALTEVSISKSKADYIMINGKAVVYEIKTDLDTLDRLETQINDYYTAFDHVCIVAGESRKSELRAMLEGTPIGLYLLTGRNTICRYKEPEKNDAWLDVEQIFRILRKAEYESIILQLCGILPKVSPVKYYRECKKVFCSYPVEKIYPLFLKELKKRNHIESIDYRLIPEALHFLVYFSKCNSNELDELSLFLSQEYKEESE